MTWLEKFDRMAAAHSDSIAWGIAESNMRQSRAGDALEALFDRYRAEGYPGMNSEIPADLLVH